ATPTASTSHTYEKKTTKSLSLSKCVPQLYPSLFFFSSRRRHTRSKRDWSSDVCSSDLIIQRTHGLAWTHVTLNTQGGDGALEDVKVREAIARGIDRDAIGRAVLEPLDSPVVLVDNFVYLPGQDGYEDSFGGLEFDPEAAGALLDDAGWVLEGETRTKDGRTLELSLVVPADTPSNFDRARQIQTNLTSIGIDVELQTV